MKQLMAIVLLVLISQFLAADIVSTTYGGNWINASTWIGGVVPDLNDNVTIQGPVRVNTTNECHDLMISSTGMITTPVDEIGQVTVYGNCVNHGQIVDGGTVGEVRLVVLGNLTNSNLISCEYVYFAGTETHSFTNSGTFNPVHLTNMGYATVILLSDLALSGTHVMLPWLNLNGGSPAHITLSGGFMEHTNILGGNGASLSLSNSAHMYNITADELVLSGTVLLSGPVTIGTLHNNGTVYNRNDADQSLTITQRLNNHGFIGNNPSGNYLYLYVNRDLYNYSSMAPQYLTLGSESTGNLWQSGSANPLTVPVVTSNGDYRLLSDFNFVGSAVSWTSHTLILHNGSSVFNLSLYGGSLVGANLDGAPGSTLTLGSNAYIAGVEADELTFDGTVLVGDNVSVGRLVNLGYLRCRDGFPQIMTVLERLENPGVITNAVSGSLLDINLWGDLLNYGMITNHRFMLYGSDDQYVLRETGSAINCADGFQLVSELGWVPWYFNGNLSVTDATYYNIVDTTVSGVWNPFNGDNFGRNIIFGSASGTISVPQNVSTVSDPSGLYLQWDQVPSALYYTVFHADEPNGSYIPYGFKAFDHNLSDGVVRYDLTGLENHGFYRVLAGK